MARSVSRLFHAVVVVGASLGACGSREDTSAPAESAATPSETASTGEGSEGAEAEGHPEVTGTAPRDPTGSGTEGAAATPAEGSDADPTGPADGSPPTPSMRARPRPATTGTTGADTHASRMDACPPGSERPFPPCYHIL